MAGRNGGHNTHLGGREKRRKNPKIEKSGKCVIPNSDEVEVDESGGRMGDGGGG